MPVSVSMQRRMSIWKLLEPDINPLIRGDKIAMARMVEAMDRLEMVNIRDCFSVTLYGVTLLCRCIIRQ